jgi:hypothetical protein
MCGNLFGLFSSCEGFYPATLISSSSGRRELLSSAQRAQLLKLAEQSW